MYDLEKFKSGDYYIHTETNDKFNKVLDWLHEQGITWASGHSLLDSRYLINDYKSDTILSYGSDGVLYGNLKNAVETELKPNEIDYRQLLLENMVQEDFRFKAPHIQIYRGYLVSYDEKEIIDLYFKYENLGYTREELVREVERLKNV